MSERWQAICLHCGTPIYTKSTPMSGWLHVKADRVLCPPSEATPIPAHELTTSENILMCGEPSRDIAERIVSTWQAIEGFPSTLNTLRMYITNIIEACRGQYTRELNPRRLGCGPVPYELGVSFKSSITGLWYQNYSPAMGGEGIEQIQVNGSLFIRAVDQLCPHGFAQDVACDLCPRSGFRWRGFDHGKGVDYLKEEINETTARLLDDLNEAGE